MNPPSSPRAGGAVAEAADPTARHLRPVGLTWHENGQVSLQGPLLELQQACDRAFLLLAAHFGAAEERHPALLPAASLDRIDYLDAFPHLANFAVALDDGEGNLDAFRAGPPVGDTGEVRLTQQAPVTDLLTPAACYHLYVEHEGEDLGGARYLTTRNTCFRREAYYRPLRRQRAFEMRELVCLGSRDEVVSFLEQCRNLVTELFRELDLPVAWEVATDPFFRPNQNPQKLFQQVHATKSEAVYSMVGDRGSGAPGSGAVGPESLAIASVNLHETHFGDAFTITCGGEPASSGCVAFGIDRWLYALTDRHAPAGGASRSDGSGEDAAAGEAGADLSALPDVEAAVRRVLAGVEARR
jgi:hypothetical protein